MEPQYKWQPVTDFYKEQQAAQAVDPEAETQQRLQEIREQARKTSKVEKKAPIGIRVFIWYLFGRAGLYLLLLMILGTFPQTDASAWLVTNLSHQLPGAAARERMAARREAFRKEAEAQGYTVYGSDESDEKTPEQAAQQQREIVMAYLLIIAILTSVVGFSWLNRSWKVRWGTMFYAGAFVAKAAVGLVTGSASGLSGQMSSSEMSSLVLSMGINGCIFCYLAFWPGVEEWFKNG